MPNQLCEDNVTPDVVNVMLFDGEARVVSETPELLGTQATVIDWDNQMTPLPLDRVVDLDDGRQVRVRRAAVWRLGDLPDEFLVAIMRAAKAQSPHRAVSDLQLKPWELAAILAGLRILCEQNARGDLPSGVDVSDIFFDMPRPSREQIEGLCERLNETA